MTWLTRQDAALAALLRALPRLPTPLPEASALFASAERHGVGGVVLDAWRAARMQLPPELERRLEALSVAQEIDHEAHLALLKRIDACLAEASLVAVALKGPLFAERYYRRPSTRATSDVDLLVRERDLDRAARALGSLGFTVADGADEARLRREHHHLHLSHPDALPLELHFRGYSGFGRVLPSEPLVARRRPAPLPGMTALGVLEPADELVFLAVHAGAHRFVRLGWLYDLALLVSRMSPRELAAGAERARAWGFGRVLAFTAGLLVEQLGLAPDRLASLGSPGRARRVIARRTAGEPQNPFVRSSTRFIYTVSLCDDRRSAARYALRASAGHVRRLVAVGS